MSGNTARIEIPPKLIPLFTSDYRYRISYGGRGSGKTKAFAKMSAVWAYKLAESGESGVVLCAREYMNSLEESSMAEVKSAIESEPWLYDYFEIGEKYIRTKNGRIRYVFTGLSRNLESIKSKANILLCWVDEAESVSESAWLKLLPTVRHPLSEIWVTYNPESSDSATHRRFRMIPPDNSMSIELNWMDNPWWNDVLEQERVNALRTNPDTYEHVFEGAFLEITEAQVFKGKFEVESFSEAGLGYPLLGVDFGFARDPTTGVECFARDNILYIRRDCGKIGLELDHTAEFFKAAIPGFEKYVSRADSARPESISYLKRHGLARMEGVKKWPGSVEDGIDFMKSFDKIIIHPECEATIKEFRHYSFKVDKNTGDVLPVIVDAWNHYIDAIRYALSPMIKNQSGSGILVF